MYYQHFWNSSNNLAVLLRFLRLEKETQNQKKTLYLIYTSITSGREKMTKYHQQEELPPTNESIYLATTKQQQF